MQVPALALLRISAVVLLTAGAIPAEELRPATVQAWNRYLAWADAKVQRELADPKRFLIEDFLPLAEKQAIRRQFIKDAAVVRRMTGVVPPGVRFEVPDGEIHHWWGGIFVPKARLPALLEFLKDYEHHAGRFSDIEKSRLLEHQGNWYRFYFRLKRTKAIVTAYYNTEQECAYCDHGPGRVSSRSNATRIAEIDNPGTSAERELPPGNDRGFLWRLVSWWRFEETPQGVIVECESASLSRGIPTFVKFIPGVASYIRSTPRESLESVLLSIRAHAPSH